METLTTLGGMETGVQIARPGTLSLAHPVKKEMLKTLEIEHRRYDARLQILMAKPYPTEAERTEELHLKKLKLRLKDRMAHLQCGS